MGRKFRLSVHRKNEERKKQAITSLTVSIPLEKVSVGRVASPLSFNVYFPLSIYATAPVSSIQQLISRLEVTQKLPQGERLPHIMVKSSVIKIIVLPLIQYINIAYNCVEWSVRTDESECNPERRSVTIFNHRRHPSSEVPHVFFTIKVFFDFSWAIYIGEKKVCDL